MIKTENKIVSWWNDNAFLGYVVDTIEDIKELIYKNSFKDIKEMLEYHIKCSNTDYIRDIKKYDLKDIDYINNFLYNNSFMVPFNKLDSRYKKIINITRDFWEASSLTGITKVEWKNYNKLDNLTGCCGFCHLNVLKIFNCPLWDRNKYNYYLTCPYEIEICCFGIYYLWSHPFNKREDIKKYGTVVLNMIDNYIKNRDILTNINLERILNE